MLSYPPPPFRQRVKGESQSSPLFPDGFPRRASEEEEEEEEREEWASRRCSVGEKVKSE